MARKVCRASIQKGVSNPILVRKKNVKFAKKCMVWSKDRKRLNATANKLSKKKGRQKKSPPNCKSNQSVSNRNEATNNGDPVPSKVASRKKRGFVAKKTIIENTILRGINCDTDDIELVQEKECLCESNDDTLKNGTQTMSKAGQDTPENVQSSSPMTTTTNDFPKSWSAKMIRYYFEPNDESRNFDHVKIMDNIEYKASDWWINDADRTGNRKSRDFFIRCAKCNQKGHTKKDCKRIVVCYVCGEFNHRYPNCPNALCLTCGRAAKNYSTNCRQCRKALNSRRRCTLCEQVWHEESLCPSKWRKYLMVPRSSCESTFRLNSKKCCYNCAQRGHFGFECPLVLQSDYPPENPLKTAFPLEQRQPGDGDNNLFDDNSNGGRDCENSARTNVDGEPDLDLSHVHDVHVIFLAEQASHLLSSEMGTFFLTNLSHKMNIRIELFSGKRSYVKLFSDDDKIINYCKNELIKWKTP